MNESNPAAAVVASNPASRRKLVKPWVWWFLLLPLVWAVANFYEWTRMVTLEAACRSLKAQAFTGLRNTLGGLRMHPLLLPASHPVLGALEQERDRLKSWRQLERERAVAAWRFTPRWAIDSLVSFSSGTEVKIEYDKHRLPDHDEVEEAYLALQLLIGIRYEPASLLESMRGSLEAEYPAKSNRLAQAIGLGR